MTNTTTLAEKMAEDAHKKEVKEAVKLFSDTTMAAIYLAGHNKGFLAGYAAAENKWIPVTPETMPEFNQWILFTSVEDWYRTIVCQWSELDIKSVTKHRNYWNDKFWMPLPTPPKQSNEKI